MSLLDNTCNQCGGVIVPQLKVEPMDASPAVLSTAFKICHGHDVTKHDGKLGEFATVGYRESFQDIRINDGASGIAYISVKQALSLLAWLNQEEKTLKQLAKEQEN